MVGAGDGWSKGGAYHPALGELVRSRILRNRAEEILTELHCEGKNITIRVPEKRLSQMLGQKRCNAAWLKKRFSLISLHVFPDPNLHDFQIEYSDIIPGDDLC